MPGPHITRNQSGAKKSGGKSRGLPSQSTAIVKRSTTICWECGSSDHKSPICSSRPNAARVKAHMEAAARSGSITNGDILAWRTANVVYTLANIDNLTIEEARTWAKYGPHWEMIFLVSCAPQITSLHTRPQTRSQTRRALTEAGGGNVGTSSHAHDSTNTQGYDPTRAQGGNQNVDRSIAMRGYGNVQNSGSGLSESERDPRSNLRSISNTDTATQQANSEHTTYESRALESLLEHIKKNGGSGQH